MSLQNEHSLDNQRLIEAYPIFKTLKGPSLISCLLGLGFQMSRLYGLVTCFYAQLVKEIVQKIRFKSPLFAQLKNRFLMRGLLLVDSRWEKQPIRKGKKETL